MGGGGQGPVCRGTGRARGVRPMRRTAHEGWRCRPCWTSCSATWTAARARAIRAVARPWHLRACSARPRCSGQASASPRASSSVAGSVAYRRGPGRRRPRHVLTGCASPPHPMPPTFDALLGETPTSPATFDRRRFRHRWRRRSGWGQWTSGVLARLSSATGATCRVMASSVLTGLGVDAVDRDRAASSGLCEPTARRWCSTAADAAVPDRQPRGRIRAARSPALTRLGWTSRCEASSPVRNGVGSPCRSYPFQRRRHWIAT